MFCSSRPYSRIRSHHQSLRNSQWTAALRSPSTDRLWLFDHSAPRKDVAASRHPPGIANTLGYLQHHLQELTEWQNVSEHAINTTLADLTAQLQQLTQLITSPAPALTITLPLAPIPSPPVSPPPPVPDTPSKQQARPKLSSPPDFSGEWSSGRAFFNSYTLYLRLVLEQFSYDKEKILWTLAFFKERWATRWSENLFH